MLLKRCLLHRDFVLPRHAIFSIFLSMSMSQSIFVLLMCDLFIFSTINHKISLIQTNLFFGHACQKFSLRVLLSFYLTFSQFQPGFAYKSVAYKKRRVMQKVPKRIKIKLLTFLCIVAHSAYANYLRNGYLHFIKTIVLKIRS